MLAAGPVHTIYTVGERQLCHWSPTPSIDMCSLVPRPSVRGRGTRLGYVVLGHQSAPPTVQFNLEIPSRNKNMINKCGYIDVLDSSVF